MSSKLNHLLKAWPKSAVCTQPWLDRHGVSKDLARKYVKSGWLESVGHGALIRAGDDVQWQGGLHALQFQHKQEVWAGGPTALAMRGFLHFLPLGREPAWLFGAPGTALPKWFVQRDWGVEVNYQAPRLFDRDEVMQVDERIRDNFVVGISTPERAAFELLYLVPDKLAFDDAANQFQGLASLDPALMQDLLERCRLVRVKRLVLFLADYYGHPWQQRLDLSRVDLGKGKRQLVKGGRLSKRFEITVPEAFFNGRQ